MKERPRFPRNEDAMETAEAESEDPEVATALKTIRKKVLTDRGIHDKVGCIVPLTPVRGTDLLDQAVKAFVSFVRAYSKHEASYVFRIKDLDLVGVAKCFGLLRLPRMPELQNANREDWEDADVNVSPTSMPIRHELTGCLVANILLSGQDKRSEATGRT